MASFVHAQNSVNHRLEEAHTSYKPSLAEDDAGSRGAAGGGSADRAAAASEYDLPAEKDIKIAPWLEKKEKAERSIKGVGFTPRALESLEIVWEQKMFNGQSMI